MNKPMREEMLRWFDEFIKDYSGYIGGYEPPKVTTVIQTIRSLIEKYGDGRPKATRKQIFDLIQDIDGKRSREYPATRMLADWLRFIGVEVEEEKP